MKLHPHQTVLPLWLLILVVGTIVGVSMGRSQSMGLYLQPVSTALDIGREPFGLSLAVSQIMIGLGAPILGGLIDRYGGRIIAACIVSIVAGLYLLYVATSTAHLLLSGVLMGIGVSGTGVNALIGTIGRLAPPDKRLSAMASIGMAAGIGGFVALPVMHLLMEFLGWRGSLVWLIVITALLAPLTFLIGGKSSALESPVREQTYREALAEAGQHSSYWMLAAGFFVCGFHVAFIMMHLPAYALDQGLSGWVGPWALAAIGITNILGTYCAGRSSHYLEKRQALTLIYLARGVVMLGFLLLPVTPAGMIVLCGLLGLVWLSTIPLTSGLVATFFGTTWMSMLFGIVFLSHQAGAFFGVWLGGKLFDLTQSYAAMWWISIALSLMAALLNWPIRERPVARLETGVRLR